MPAALATTKQGTSRLALRFVLALGIVDLFADLTYESARSIVRPFLGSLGASATIVSFVAGLGELMGYGLRSVSGYVAHKTHRNWLVIFLGYLVNMLAVPALALAGNWPMAGALVVLERTGGMAGCKDHASRHAGVGLLEDPNVGEIIQSIGRLRHSTKTSSLTASLAAKYVLVKQAGWIYPVTSIRPHCRGSARTIVRPAEARHRSACLEAANPAGAGCVPGRRVR